jgi:hypothetical protein
LFHSVYTHQGFTRISRTPPPYIHCRHFPSLELERAEQAAEARLAPQRLAAARKAAAIARVQNRAPRDPRADDPDPSTLVAAEERRVAEALAGGAGAAAGGLGGAAAHPEQDALARRKAEMMAKYAAASVTQ